MKQSVRARSVSNGSDEQLQRRAAGVASIAGVGLVIVSGSLFVLGGAGLRLGERQ